MSSSRIPEIKDLPPENYRKKHHGDVKRKAVTQFPGEEKEEKENTFAVNTNQPSSLKKKRIFGPGVSITQTSIFRQVTKTNLCSEYYYHGIGLDLTKLTLINQFGILNAIDGAKFIPELFSQSCGVTESKNIGGINGKGAISVSKFNSRAYNTYSKSYISILVAINKIDKDRVEAFVRGCVEGEIQIKGSIEFDSSDPSNSAIRGLCIPPAIKNKPIGEDIGQSVLGGSSSASVKCAAFFKRVHMLYHYSNQHEEEILMNLAQEYDKENESSNDRASVIEKFKLLASHLDEYFKAAIASKYPEIKTYGDYMEKQELNKLRSLVYKPTVYDAPAQNSSIFARIGQNIDF